MHYISVLHFFFYLIGCMTILHFVCPFIHWQAFACFHISAFMNNDTLYKFLCEQQLCGYIPKSSISRSNDNSLYNFVRNCKTIFQSSYTILLPYQQFLCLLSKKSLPNLMLWRLTLIFSKLLEFFSIHVCFWTIF